MLARSFKTAADLGISEEERDALIKVLGMLERNELQYGDHRTPHHGQLFNMDQTCTVTPCGTVACILGWARIVSGLGDRLFPWDLENYGKPALLELFMVMQLRKHRFWHEKRRSVTPAQAAHALSNYLTTGHPRWDEALAAKS